MTRPWIAIVFVLASSTAVASCGGDDDPSGRLHGPPGLHGDAGMALIQPTCVDDRLPDQDGVDDGQTCESSDTGAICTITSGCPNYCVHCSDGTSLCSACPP